MPFRRFEHGLRGMTLKGNSRPTILIASRVRVKVEQYKFICRNAKLCADLEGDFLNGIGDALPWIVVYLFADDGNATVTEKVSIDAADTVNTIAGLVCE